MTSRACPHFTAGALAAYRRAVRLINHTPCPALAFEGRAVDDEPFHVLVLRGTWLLPREGRAKMAPEQLPLVMADAFYGEPGASSPREESDLAPFKPRCDVIVVGDARSPGGVPTPSWIAGVRVGDHTASVRVTGPRAWERASGWKLSAPQPCASVPLRYELAFGGGGDDEKLAQNPVGVGHLGRRSLDGVDRVEAPQIESPEEPVIELGRAYAPRGLGVIGRAWQPRLARAGSYDDAWLANTWPALPADFDFNYWNGAHPDLTVRPWLRGNEPVELFGMHHDGPRRFELPDVYVYALVHYEDAPAAPLPMKLDTLIVDAERDLVSLVWRLALPAIPEVREVEARMARSTRSEVTRGR